MEATYNSSFINTLLNSLQMQIQKPNKNIKGKNKDQNSDSFWLKLAFSIQVSF